MLTIRIYDPPTSATFEREGEMIDLIINTLGIVGVASIVLAVFMLIRNEAVYRMRINLIHQDMRAYKRLPPYDSMMWRFWSWRIEDFQCSADGGTRAQGRSLWPVIGYGCAWLLTCCVTGACMAAFHHATSNLGQVLWASASFISFSFSLDFMRAMLRDRSAK